MITCGLVLAAGRSERFGAANTLLAPYDGKPPAAHVAKAMGAVALEHRLVVALADMPLVDAALLEMDSHRAGDAAGRACDSAPRHAGRCRLPG